MSNDLESERRRLTPETGFALISTDYFAETGAEMYIVDTFDMYQDALYAKKNKKNPDEYYIVYKDSDGKYLYR